MDPLGSLAKGAAGAALDKMQEILERDQTSEDAIKDAKLKKSLLSAIDAADKRVRNEPGSVRPSRGTSQTS